MTADDAAFLAPRAPLLVDHLPASSGRQTLVLGAGLRDAVPGLKQDQLTFGSLSSMLQPAGMRAFPYSSDQFDLIICDHISALIAVSEPLLCEFGRILRPGGCLLISDLLVPGSHLRGKKARQMREAGAYINTWFRLRNSHHAGFLSWNQWTWLLQETHFHIEVSDMPVVRTDFDTWLAGSAIGSEDQIRLRVMLLQAPEKVKEFLTPTLANARIAFHMTGVALLARATGHDQVRPDGGAG